MVLRNDRNDKDLSRCVAIYYTAVGRLGKPDSDTAGFCLKRHTPVSCSWKWRFVLTINLLKTDWVRLQQRLARTSGNSPLRHVRAIDLQRARSPRRPAPRLGARAGARPRRTGMGGGVGDHRRAQARTGRSRRRRVRRRRGVPRALARMGGRAAPCSLRPMARWSPGSGHTEPDTTCSISASSSP